MSADELTPREMAELQKIEAETRKIEAERIRIELERKELEKPWFRKRSFFQAVTAGLVAIPLIWFYVVQIAIPLYQSDNIQLKNTNIKVADSLSTAKKQLEINERRFQAKTDSMEKVWISQLSNLNEKYKQLQVDREKLAQRYNELSKSAFIAKIEADKFKQKYQETQKEVEQSKSEEQKLTKQINELENVFRSTRQPFSSDEVKSMLKKHNYYDKYKNENAPGFANEFELQKNCQVVYDRASGLIWQQAGLSESITYEKAKEYITQLNSDGFAGFTDWRLPTLEEAMSLMEPKKMNGDLFIDPIFDKSQRYIWTADQVKGEFRAWVVYFSSGLCSDYQFGSLNFSVRGVRSGQSSGGH